MPVEPGWVQIVFRIDPTLLERKARILPKIKMEKAFLSIKEISDYLCLKVSTVYALVEQKKIPHYRIGRLIRFKKSEIDSWMDQNKEDRFDGKEIRKVSEAYYRHKKGN